LQFAIHLATGAAHAPGGAQSFAARGEVHLGQTLGGVAAHHLIRFVATVSRRSTIQSQGDGV
jgi:hypothetical protein